MNIQNLFNNATRNTRAMDNLKAAMRQVIRLADTFDVGKFEYDVKENTFKYVFRRSDFIHLWDVAIFRYDEVTVELNGITLKASYDHWDDDYDFIMTVTKQSSLWQKLEDCRQILRRAYFAEVAKNVRQYFIENEEEYTKYPTVLCGHTGNIYSRKHIVWACGAEESEVSQINTPESQNFIAISGGCAHYSFYEKLNDEYRPVILVNDDDVEACVRLDNYFDMVVSRNVPYHKDSIMYTPALYMGFVMKAPVTDAYQHAFNEIHAWIDGEKERQFTEFVRKMEKINWNLLDKNQIQADIPIIYDAYTDYIIEKARMTYPEDIFRFERTKKVCPLFDDCINDNMSTCIKVTITR